MPSREREWFEESVRSLPPLSGRPGLLLVLPELREASQGPLVQVQKLGLHGRFLGVHKGQLLG